MSREVRRVPLDYRHPTASYSYVGLKTDYVGAVADYEKTRADLAARRGHDWEWSVLYHLTGYQACDEDRPVQHLYYPPEDPHAAGIVCTDEDHLHELLLADAENPPDPERYMPVWPADTVLGWCLYETVTEGTPVTPIFEASAYLVEHLCRIGQSPDFVPMRRTAAVTLVRAGSTIGSGVVRGGVIYKSDMDADRIEHMLGRVTR